MKREGFYTSGEFAKKAHVSVRTIRFYDKQNILKPSDVSESGTRFYSDEDFVRLQQILLLKYLGFSLAEIKQMTIDHSDVAELSRSLKLQQQLISDKIEQFQLIRQAIENTAHTLETEKTLDWSQMLELIHLTSMENSLQLQYQNANNISARIHLHDMYSTNPMGWFPWVYSNLALTSQMNVLEIGCGSGALWTTNRELLPDDISIVLSDISEGMLRDSRRYLLQCEDALLQKNIHLSSPHFSFQAIDCHSIPYPDASFDYVIANHVLFYCDNLAQVFAEIARILKPNGIFMCSTYSGKHMQEISQLVTKFDARIVLSAQNLYEQFGLENGKELLTPYFKDIALNMYEDSLLVDRPEPLIEYILSCHGNQNQYLLDRYLAFRNFVNEKLEKPFFITKEAGLFLSHPKK